MKKYFQWMLMAFLGVATVGMVGCGGSDDPGDEPTPTPVAQTLEGHSYYGTIDNAGTIEVEGQQVEVAMEVTFQFKTATTATTVITVMLPGAAPQTKNVASTWVESDGRGTVTMQGTQDIEFRWDKNAKTMYVNDFYINLNLHGERFSCGGSINMREVE